MNNSDWAIGCTLKKIIEERGLRQNFVADKCGYSTKKFSITGVLPVNKGGTGANNVKQTKKNLGIQKHCYIVAAGNSDSNLKDYADFIIEGEKDFQNVIDSVPSGSVIRFLSGNYYLYSSSLKIDKQLILEGSGHQTVIYANGLNNQPVFKLGTDDVEKPTSNITIKPMLEKPTLENPILDKPMSEKPTLENPILDNPTQEKPTLENPTQINKDKTIKEKINTDCIKYQSINPSEQTNPDERLIERYNKTKSEIKKQIDYDTLILSNNEDIINDIVEVMTDVMVVDTKYYVIGKKEIPAELVKIRYKQLNYGKIEALMLAFAVT